MTAPPSTYTPGPWHVEAWDYPTIAHRRNVPTIQTAADAIAEACPLWRNGEDSEDERNANARLIAAAPELVEALEKVVRVAMDGRYRPGYEATPHIEKARALLARIREGA